MQEQLKQRRNQLKQEFETGQKKLQELEIQQAHLREMLLRISGAIQVLEEELAKADGATAGTSETQGTGLTPPART